MSYTSFIYYFYFLQIFWTFHHPLYICETFWIWIDTGEAGRTKGGTLQELGRDTDTGEAGRTKIVVEMLEQTKKLIEERPGDIVLDQETKLLRQVCFKEQFKRRRLMALDG